MEALSDFLIALLNEFKSSPAIAQLAYLCAVLAAFAIPAGAFFRFLRLRERRLAQDAALTERDLKLAKEALASLRLDNERLSRFQPESVLHRLDRERSDENRSRMVWEAMDYMEHHRAAFAEACGILAEHHLSRWEDGTDALHRARTAAMGATAAAPDDRNLALLLDEIERLQRVEAAPPETREESRQREERDRLRRLLREAPSDVEALRAIGQQEFAAGRYRIAMVLWERAEAALLAEGFESNSPGPLDIRLDLGEAALAAGLPAAARALIAPLPDLFARAISSTDSATLYARNLLGRLLIMEGSYHSAENGLRDLLSLQAQVQGEEHPGTFSTRFELARAILEQGRAQEAEQMFRDLLPLTAQLEGEEHPNTLSARHELARAILTQGRAEEAERLFRDLLPLRAKVQGDEHPEVLINCHNLAHAILDQGRAVEAEQMFRDLLPLRAKVQGDEHPGTLATRHGFARAILEQGRAQEAEQMFRELLPVWAKAQGEEHPGTLAIRLAHAQAALEQGDAEHARDALAPLLADGGSSVQSGRIALLHAWLADLDGNAAEAKTLLNRAEEHLATVVSEHYAHRAFVRYRETRVPGGAGGTKIPPADGA